MKSFSNYSKNKRKNVQKNTKAMLKKESSTKQQKTIKKSVLFLKFSTKSNTSLRKPINKEKKSIALSLNNFKK